MSVVEGTSLNNDEYFKNLPSHVLGAQKSITSAFYDASEHSTQQQVYNAVEWSDKEIKQEQVIISTTALSSLALNI